MELPPAPLVPDAARAGAGGAARELAALREARRATCACEAAEVRWVARIAARCRAEVHERVRALGDTRLDIDAEGFAEELAVDTVGCALGVSKSEAAGLVSLSDRLTVLPAVWDAWQSGALDGSRVRVLARATEVLDDATARAVAGDLLASAGGAPWQGPAPRSWRTQVERAVVHADGAAAERRRAAAVAARRVRAWAEGDGTGVLQLHADAADIALADQVVSDLAHAWSATDPDGVRLSMDQRRADALIGLFRAVRDGSLARYSDPGALAGQAAGTVGGCVRADASPTSGAGSAFGAAAGQPFGPAAGSGFAPAVRLPRVPVRRVHDLGLVLHTDTLFGDGPAADETGQLRGLGRPAVLAPGSARTLARRQLENGTSVQVLVVDHTGALARVVPVDRTVCRSRTSLTAAVRQQLTGAPELEADGHDPTEAIARHVRGAAPTCSFYDCPRQARSCDLDHDTPWPRGPTSTSNLDPKCRRHHNAKTLGAARTRLTAGPGTGPRTVHWTLPAGVQATTSPEPLPGAGLRSTPAAGWHSSRLATEQAKGRE
jgi:Domain of unknown function (DUF222)